MKCPQQVTAAQQHQFHVHSKRHMKAISPGMSLMSFIRTLRLLLSGFNCPE